MDYAAELFNSALHCVSTHRLGRDQRVGVGATDYYDSRLWLNAVFPNLFNCILFACIVQEQHLFNIKEEEYE